MTSWYVKAALQGSMSHLPDPQRANRVFQRVVTGRLGLSEDFFQKKLVAAAQHLNNWRNATHQRGVPDRVIELGTGWHPVVPIALALHGVPSVTSVDLQPLFQDEQIIETLEALHSHVVTNPAEFPEAAESRVRMALAMSPGDGRQRLASLGVNSWVADASALDVEDATIDLVTSNNTLEHIPEGALAAILSEFRRVIAPNGVSSHLVDLADHYAGFDSNLTPYHFLRFSERQWAWFNNSLQYQNRLRHPQYLEIFERAGWFLSAQDLDGDVRCLASEPVHPDFGHMNMEDLAVHTAWVTHRPGRVG